MFEQDKIWYVIIYTKIWLRRLTTKKMLIKFVSKLRTRYFYLSPQDIGIFIFRRVHQAHPRIVFRSSNEGRRHLNFIKSILIRQMP